MAKLGAIYYTDNRIDGSLISNTCREKIREGFDGEIISVSLKPIDFGKNIVLENENRSYLTMVKQILMALEHSTADYVFYLEHDVLYHPSHFDYVPPTDDVYYYNTNNWRWWFLSNKLITYGKLSALSSLCCNRELAIRHYRYRLQLIEERGLDKIGGRDPGWARRLGYEPGTKPIRRGGVTDETHIRRRSEFPIIDIRHKYTFSPPKVNYEDYIRKPTNWQEPTMDEVPGWNLKDLFKGVL